MFYMARYCRFYAGRRSEDDERQISRWSGVCGANGRFKKSLVKKIAQSGGRWDDESVAPVLRQTCEMLCLRWAHEANTYMFGLVHHWGYVLTEADYRAFLE